MVQEKLVDEKITREELGSWLWGAADILRETGRPEGHGNYILPCKQMRLLTKKHLLTLLSLVLILSVFVPTVFAWSNGGYSDDPSNPDYGTHDWMAQHALDWLPSDEREFIENNLTIYLYGTELPDNGQASDGIGDTLRHHIYYFSNGSLQDDSSAVRASEEYNITLSYLNANDFVNAAKHAGIMTHYIADMAVFGHVMGSSTNWGTEQHHSDYENYVNSRTNSYDDDFNTYLSYDGSFDIITAYDAAKNLAYDTTFDIDGDLTCVRMDQHYNWSNPVFKDRCGESLNLAVNYLTDVLHTLYISRSNAKRASSISCEVSSSSITIGDSVTVSGSISPSRSGVTVTISYKSNGSWSILATMTSASDGSYSYSWTPTSAGSYQLKASWEGDSTYSEATSSAVSVTVTKISTTISCSVSPSEVTEGNSITVSGSISPALSGKTVMLTYEKPDGSTFTRMVTTGSGGSFSDTYTPTGTGFWSVKASWEGDAEHEGSSSTIISFTVKKKKGCIIATATYGSELSPEVQFLREFRDNTVLNTFAGKNFMNVFNAWYYSFSPTVASIIEGNNLLRGFMKIILYPLIGILHIAATTYSLLNFNPEFAVVISGLVASSLIGIVYFSPCVLILCLIKKVKIPTKALHVSLLIWVVSIGCITIAEIIKWPGMTMFSTAMFVLTSISISSLIFMKLLMEHLLNYRNALEFTCAKKVR